MIINDMSITDIRAMNLACPGWSHGLNFELPQGDETRRSILGRRLQRKKYAQIAEQKKLDRKVIQSLTSDK